MLSEKEIKEEAMSNTVSETEQTKLNPIEDQRAEALKHYEEASSAIHHWSSFVSNAIKAYNPASATPVEDGLRWVKGLAENIQHHIDMWSDEPDRVIRLVQRELDAFATERCPDCGYKYTDMGVCCGNCIERKYPSSPTPSPSIEAGLPINTFHAECPKCGEKIDIIPPHNTVIRQDEDWLPKWNSSEYLERLKKLQNQPSIEGLSKEGIKDFLRNKIKNVNINVTFAGWIDGHLNINDIANWIEEYKNQPTPASSKEDKK